MAQTLSQTRIKVDRVALIARLRKVLSEGDGDYRKLVAAREAALRKAKEELRAQVAALAKNPDPRIEAAAKAARGRYEQTLSLALNTKTEVPPEPRDTACDLRNTIAVLELSKEETVPLSAEQYARYFPCEV